MSQGAESADRKGAEAALRMALVALKLSLGWRRRVGLTTLFQETGPLPESKRATCERASANL